MWEIWMKKGIVFGVLICLLLCGFIPARRQDDMEMSGTTGRSVMPCTIIHWENRRMSGCTGQDIFHGSLRPDITFPVLGKTMIWHFRS